MKQKLKAKYIQMNCLLFTGLLKVFRNGEDLDALIWLLFW